MRFHKRILNRVGIARANLVDFIDGTTRAATQQSEGQTPYEIYWAQLPEMKAAA